MRGPAGTSRFAAFPRRRLPVFWSPRGRSAQGAPFALVLPGWCGQNCPDATAITGGVLPLTLQMRQMPDTAVAPPRARGSVLLTARQAGGGTGLDRLRCSGAMKALFPRRTDVLQAILINSSGGVTGGDRLTVKAAAGPGARLCLTTQAAERAYRAAGGWARIDTRLSAEDGAVLFWLPQELILYDGASLRRSLRIDLAPSARLLMVEPVVFGRHAMGERLRAARFHDRITIFRGGAPAYADAVQLSGDIAARLARPASAAGAGAMVSLVHIAPDAESHLDAVRALMPETGGASLLQPDMLVLRLLAPDSYLMRRALLPVLDRLTGDALPTSWRL